VLVKAIGYVMTGAVGVGITTWYGFATRVGVRDGITIGGRPVPVPGSMTRVYVGAGVAVEVGNAVARRVSVGDGSTMATAGESFAKMYAANVPTANVPMPASSQQIQRNKTARMAICGAENRVLISLLTVHG